MTYITTTHLGRQESKFIATIDPIPFPLSPIRISEPTVYSESSNIYSKEPARASSEYPYPTYSSDARSMGYENTDTATQLDQREIMDRLEFMTQRIRRLEAEQGHQQTMTPPPGYHAW